MSVVLLVLVRDNWDKITDFTDATYPTSLTGMLTFLNYITCKHSVFIYFLLQYE